MAAVTSFENALLALSGYRWIVLDKIYLLKEQFNSMYGKLKDLKTYKLVYPHIIQHYYLDGPEVEVESDVHGNARG